MHSISILLFIGLNDYVVFFSRCIMRDFFLPFVGIFAILRNPKRNNNKIPWVYAAVYYYNTLVFFVLCAESIRIIVIILYRLNGVHVVPVCVDCYWNECEIVFFFSLPLRSLKKDAI